MGTGCSSWLAGWGKRMWCHWATEITSTPTLPNRQLLPLGFMHKHKHSPKKSCRAVNCASGLKTSQVFNQKTLNISETFVCSGSLAAPASYLTWLIRPGSPRFSRSCVKFCISLIKIIQMCLAELIFICLFFLKLCKSLLSDTISGKQQRWHYSNVKNRRAAAPSSMVCFIVKRIGTLNRYYIIVVSIPDTLIVIPPTHTLCGKTSYTGCILLNWAVRRSFRFLQQAAQRKLLVSCAHSDY